MIIMATADLQRSVMPEQRGPRKRYFPRKKHETSVSIMEEGGAGRPATNNASNSSRELRSKKRTYSGNKKNWPPKRMRRGTQILPTIFLLGGNINDPLNLASLQDDETNRLMNAVTPKSSPLPTPKHRREKIEVPELDPTDPLMLLAPPMSSIKKRKRKRKASSPVGPNAKEAKLSEMPPTDSTGRPLKLSLMRKSLSNRTISEIVSPVVPQPGEWRRKVHKKIVTASIIAAAIDKKHSSYRYGNYDRYYGYRVKKYGPEDPRLSLLGPERFEGKDVLDIGCNSGELTIAMALFGAKSVVGVDIDADLINQAIKNQRLFLAGERSIVLDEKKELELRASKPTLKNLIFVSGDYVLKEDCMVDEQKQHFDVITCLSVTKWIQLNHGDAGLKRAFRRMFAQLRPGGVLYLEPQPYSSYTLKKNVTSQTLENYKKMKFYPESFPEFLLQTVGFSALDVVGTPSHMSNGFQREIFKFTKPPDAKKKG